MNKQMLFLLMCVSPVILNGMFKPTQTAANVGIAPDETLQKTVEELKKQMAELSVKSQNEFVRGMAVAGTVGAMAYYFLPKAKNRFHLGMGTIGAAAAGYGVNMYYDTLASFAQNNPTASGLAAITTGVIYYNRQYVKDTILGLKDSSLYKWLFDDLPTTA